MKNKKIIEAFDQMLPEEERHEKNLEQIISRLEAQGFNGEALFCEEDKRNGTGKNHKTNTSIKMLKRITAVAAALIAAIGIMFATNSEALAGVLNWFRHEKEDDPKSYVYEFKEDYSNIKLPQITIGWLPDDFEGVKPRIGAMDDEYTYSRAYETNKGRRIDILIDHMDKGGRIYVMSEPEEELQVEELTVNGKRADYFEDTHKKGIYVFDDVNGLYIEIVTNLEKDEVIKIAEYIQFVFE